MLEYADKILCIQDELLYAFGMALFENLKKVVATKLLGELITDFGSLPTDEHGRELAMSIRRFPGNKPHLQLKWTGTGETEYWQIMCSEDWAKQLERVAAEMRKELRNT